MSGVMIDSAKHLPYPEIEHTARVMVCDPVALAFEWIKAYGDHLTGMYYDDVFHHISVDELVDTAMSNLEGSSNWADTYINKGSVLDGEIVDPVFWEKLAILKGIEIPAEKRNSFFSCSC